jgi:hypothetical protein
MRASCVLAKSQGRQAKEIAIRRKRLAQLLLRIGAAKKEAGRAFGFVKTRLPQKDEAVTRHTFSFQVDKAKLKLYPTDSDRIRFPFSEKRVGNPAHLSSIGASGRRSRLDCLPCLLPASHAEESADDSCTRFDPERSIRKAGDDSNGRGLDSHAGRPMAGITASHAAGKGRSGCSGPAPHHITFAASASH